MFCFNYTANTYIAPIERSLPLYKALINTGSIYQTKAILEIAKEISERYDIEFEKIGTDRYHIHILTSFHPKYSGADVVRIFKSITAKQIFQQFPELRKDLWGGEFWSDGYYIATISERGNWKAVERYVENQGKTMQQSPQLTLWE